MLLIITILLSFLVAVNFILLVFSCNKTANRTKKSLENKHIFAVTKNNVIPTATVQLAATGS